MKHKLAVIALAISLTGCAAIQDRVANFWLARWDAQEARLAAYTVIRAQDTVAICAADTPQERQVKVTGRMARAAQHLLAYSQTLPDDNRPVIAVARNLSDSATEFHKKAEAKMSRLYCENKARNMVAMSEQAVRVVQSKRK